MAVSQHRQLSRSFCVVSSERHSHSCYIPGKGRCLNAILYCSLPSLFLPLARYTPQHRVLIYKNKTKRQYESFEPHWHRSIYRVRMSRPALPIQSAITSTEQLVFGCTKRPATLGSACSSHAKSMEQVKYQTWSKPQTLPIWKSSDKGKSFCFLALIALILSTFSRCGWFQWQNSFIQTSGRTYKGQKGLEQYIWMRNGGREKKKVFSLYCDDVLYKIHRHPYSPWCVHCVYEMGLRQSSANSLSEELTCQNLDLLPVQVIHLPSTKNTQAPTQNKFRRLWAQKEGGPPSKKV